MIDVQSIRGMLDVATVTRFSAVIPDDQLKAKRLRNLSVAVQVVVALNGEVPVGLVYVRRILGVPNVTWLVAENARRQGLAVRMLDRLQQDCRWLTAICRNDASIAVARRAGFKRVGPFALWLRPLVTNR